jgi:hypothetical protein
MTKKKIANDLDSQLSKDNIFNEQQAGQAIYLGSRRLAGQLKTATRNRHSA